MSAYLSVFCMTMILNRLINIHPLCSSQVSSWRLISAHTDGKGRAPAMEEQQPTLLYNGELPMQVTLLRPRAAWPQQGTAGPHRWWSHTGLQVPTTGAA